MTVFTFPRNAMLVIFLVLAAALQQAVGRCTGTIRAPCGSSRFTQDLCTSSTDCRRTFDDCRYNSDCKDGCRCSQVNYRGIWEGLVKCIGTPNPCASYTTESTCESYLGCDWEDGPTSAPTTNQPSPAPSPAFPQDMIVVENFSNDLYWIDVDHQTEGVTGEDIPINVPPRPDPFATIITTSSPVTAIDGLAFSTDGILYAWDRINRSLWSADLLGTGTWTLVGGPGDDAPDCALFGVGFDIRPTDNAAIVFDLCAHAIYDIDLNDGSTKFRVAASGQLGSLGTAFAQDGTLFQLADEGRLLQAVDIDSGELVDIGETGISGYRPNLERPNTLAFNPEDGMLYAIDRYKLFRLDTFTGKATSYGFIRVVGQPNATPWFEAATFRIPSLPTEPPVVIPTEVPIQPSPAPSDTLSTPVPTNSQTDSSSLVQLGYFHQQDSSNGWLFGTPETSSDGDLTFDSNDGVTDLMTCAKQCQSSNTKAGSWNSRTETCFCYGTLDKCLEPCIEEVGIEFSSMSFSEFEYCDQSFCDYYGDEFMDYCAQVSYDAAACNAKIGNAQYEDEDENSSSAAAVTSRLLASVLGCFLLGL